MFQLKIVQNLIKNASGFQVKIVQLVKSQDTLTGERNAEPIVGATIKVLMMTIPCSGGGQDENLGSNDNPNLRADDSTGRILIA